MCLTLGVGYVDVDGGPIGFPPFIVNHFDPCLGGMDGCWVVQKVKTCAFSLNPFGGAAQVPLFGILEGQRCGVGHCGFKQLVMVGDGTGKYILQKINIIYFLIKSW